MEAAFPQGWCGWHEVCPLPTVPCTVAVFIADQSVGLAAEVGSLNSRLHQDAASGGSPCRLPVVSQLHSDGEYVDLDIRVNTVGGADGWIMGPVLAAGVVQKGLQEGLTAG